MKVACSAVDLAREEEGCGVLVDCRVACGHRGPCATPRPINLYVRQDLVNVFLILGHFWQLHILCCDLGNTRVKQRTMETAMTRVRVNRQLVVGIERLSVCCTAIRFTRRRLHTGAFCTKSAFGGCCFQICTEQAHTANHTQVCF